MEARRPDLLVEFVGLPGSGKSTIARALGEGWKTKHSLPFTPVPLSKRLAFYRAAWPFFLSLRPFRLHEFQRMRKLGAELSLYVYNTGGPVVLDQGMIQKLWSTLVGHHGFGMEPLEHLIQTLAPTAADLVVWVRTSPEEAASRIAARTGGRSRFDKMPLETIVSELRKADEFYSILISLYRKHAQFNLIELSGNEPVTSSARLVKDAELALSWRRSTTAAES